MTASRVRDAAPDQMAPVLSWDDFLSYVFIWNQNQHVGLVGPTEQGKTNLGYHLLQLRRFVTYFAIKPYDETLEAFVKSKSDGSFTRLYDWPPEKKRLILPNKRITAEQMPRRMLWPDARALDSEEEQQRVFTKALADIYADGGWCTVLDDYWYMANILGFEKQTKKFLANARSNYIPMMIAVQRPSGNRLVEIFDQTTHLFFFRDNDETNLQRIGGVGWLAANPIKSFVARLEPFQFLYVNTRKGWMYRSTAPELKIGGRKR